MAWKTSSLWLFFCSHFFLFGQSSAQGLSSCDGRCGESYSREASCQCDYTCDVFMECCPDFRKFCTSEASCKGRCHEKFERGRECDCDDNCGTYSKCCSDYKEHCIEPTEKQTSPPTRPSTTPQTPTKAKTDPTKKPKETLDKKKPKKDTKPKEKAKDPSRKPSSSPSSSQSPDEEVPNEKQPSPTSPKKKPMKGLTPEEDASDSGQPPPPGDKKSKQKPSPESAKKKKPGNAEAQSPGNADNPSSPADGKAAGNPSSKPKKRKRPGDLTNSDEESAGSPSSPAANDKTGKKTPANSPKNKSKEATPEALEKSPTPDGSRTSRNPKTKPPLEQIYSGEDLPEHLLDQISALYPALSNPEDNMDEGNHSPKSPKKKRKWTVSYSEEEEPLEDPENPSSASTGKKTPKEKSPKSPKKKPGHATDSEREPAEDPENPSSASTGKKTPKEKSPKSPKKKPGHATDAEGEPAELSDDPLSTLASLSSDEGRKSTMKRSPKSPNNKILPKANPSNNEEQDPSLAAQKAKAKTAKKKKSKKPKDQEEETEEVRESENESLTESSSSSSSSSHQSNKAVSRSVSKIVGKKKKKTNPDDKTKDPKKENVKQTVKAVKLPTTTPALHLQETPGLWDLPWYSTPGQEQRKPVTRSTPRTYPTIPSTDRPEIKSTTLKVFTTLPTETERRTNSTPATTTLPSTTRTTTKPAFVFEWTTEQRRVPQSSTSATPHPCPASMSGSGQKRTAVPPLPNMCTTTAIPEKVTPKKPDIISSLQGIQIVNASLLKDDMNLCNGRPVDGMTTLQNGSLVAFRGHYFWTLNQFGRGTGNPRRITDVWGVPSPIDTVFTRCNCEGKTFFFKDSSYWRFTNDAMDSGYPKLITKGFGGLTGRPTAVLSVAAYKKRVESVYFFKSGGTVQQYTYKQEPAKKCEQRKRPKPHYPVYTHGSRNGRFRTVRDVFAHRIVEKRTYSTVRNVQLSLPSKGVLHTEVSVRTAWRGIPNDILSAVSLPHPQKPDGYDYFVFSKDKYYNLNASSRTAMKLPVQKQQKTSKDWYKCPE